MTAKRWRRHGKHRLYVTASDRTRLGWRHLVTGEPALEHPGHPEAFHAAVSAGDADARGAAPTPTEPGQTGQTAQPGQSEQSEQSEQSGQPGQPGQPVTPSVPPPEPVLEDLAVRQAVETARDRAVAPKREAPVRTVVARVLGRHTDKRAWRTGADGAQPVAARLGMLAKKDPRWRFLHAIEVGDRGIDIDHVVIGPGGVYALNAKHHPEGHIWVGGDTVLVNGRRQPYLHTSRHEASLASRLLTAACGFPVVVIGVVVAVGAHDVTVGTPPDDVHVVSWTALNRWLRSRREVLDDATVGAVFDAARRSTTWQP